MHVDNGDDKNNQPTRPLHELLGLPMPHEIDSCLLTLYDYSHVVNEMGGSAV